MNLGKTIGFFGLLIGAIACSTVSGQKNTAEKFETLVWSDEFNYNGLPDSSKWSYVYGDGCPNLCGWGNNELEFYTKKDLDNAYVSDGFLEITLMKEKSGQSEYTSAKITTQGKGDWTYGRFEIRAKLPGGKGTWPAIWMMPSQSKYGGWPKSGEIDIMEKVGYDPDSIVSSAHTESFNHVMGTHKNNAVYIGDNEEVFHTYSLVWDAQKYQTYIDDTLCFTFVNDQSGSASWPFDQPFYLILNIAYGGNWGGLKGLDDSALPAKMQVDYVRVYQ